MMAERVMLCRLSYETLLVCGLGLLCPVAATDRYERMGQPRVGRVTDNIETQASVPCMS